jgi:hypothetical protein
MPRSIAFVSERIAFVCFGLLVCFVAGAFIACDRTESSSTVSEPAAAARDEALVRVVNAAPASGSLDVFAGDLILFDGLSFKAVTPYRAVEGKRYDFALRPAGMTQAKPLSSNTEGLDKGHYYTAVAMPGDGPAPRLRIVSDSVDRPAAGKARLRVVHAGVDAGTIQLRMAGADAPVIDDIGAQTITDYRDVSPVDGTIEVIGEHQQQPLASIRTHLEAGRFYTIVIAGRAGAEPGLEGFLVEDAISP